MNAKIDVTDIIIDTPRIRIRPWQMEDLDDCYEYASVDGVGQMAGWEPHQNKEESLRVLNLFLTGKRTLALELKETGKVIGSLGLEEYNEKIFDGMFDELVGCELGYVLGKPYWGKGIMPEVVRNVINYCFDTMNFDFLTVGHFVTNRQSESVIKKCGFTFHSENMIHTRMGTIEEEKCYVLMNNRI